MKRGLSGILAGLLLLLMLPIKVLADGEATITYFREFSIWENDDDYFSCSYLGEMSGNGWSFKKGTLTLNGFDGKYLTLCDVCTIVLADGSVNNIEYGACFEDSRVTIQGNGTLNLGNSLECVDTELIIDGATVNITQKTLEPFEVYVLPYVEMEYDSHFQTSYDCDISAGGVHTKESGLELFYGSNLVFKKGTLNISDTNYGIYVGDAEVMNGKIKNSEILGGKISIYNTDSAVSIRIDGSNNWEEYQKNPSSVFNNAQFDDGVDNLKWCVDDNHVIHLKTEGGALAKTAYVDMAASKDDEESDLDSESQLPSLRPSNPANNESFETETDSIERKVSTIDYLAMSHLAYLEWQEGDVIRNKISLNKPMDNTAQEITYGMLCKNILDWHVFMISSVENSGFYAVAFYNEKLKEVVISFRGSAGLNEILSKPGDVLDDWLFNDLEFHLSPHKYTPQLEAATWCYNSCKAMMDEKNLADYRLTLTGHSLGGALAQVVSMTTGTYGEVFNAASVYEALYGNLPFAMSTAFNGVDKWNFIAHVSEGDNVVARHNNEYQNLPHILYKNTHHGGLFYPHSLSNFLFVDSLTGKLSLYPLTTVKIPDAFSEAEVSNYPYLYFGSSEDDKIVTQILTEGFEQNIYGGAGNDVIICHGATNDYIAGGTSTKHDVLNGGRGNDTYIYHKGDGVKYIIDCEGEDTICLIGLQNEDKLTIEDAHGNKYKLILLNGVPILYISTNRSSNCDYVIDAQGYKNTLDIKGKWGKFYSYYIACPVDIDIIDPHGAVVLTLKDKENISTQTDYGYFYVFEDEKGESHKRVDLIEGYTAQIRGVGVGMMNIAVLHDGENPKHEIVGATNIPVTTNTIATFSFAEGRPATLTIMDEEGNKREVLLQPSKKITLDTETDAFSIAQVFSDFDGTILNLPVPVRKGYEFLSWITTTGLAVSEGDKIEQDITLYATWENKNEEALISPPAPKEQSRWLINISTAFCVIVISSIAVFLLQKRRKKLKE